VPACHSQHPLAAPLAANGVSHAFRQAAALAAVGVATVLPPQAVTLAAAAPQVSGMAQLPPALVPVPGVKAPLRHQQSPLPSTNQHPLDIPAAAIAVSHWSWHCVVVRWPRSIAATAPSVHSKAVATVVHPSGAANVAVTVVAAAMATVQVVAVLLVHPVHPTNTDPSAAVGVSVRVTLVP
jgi:hypothetical protein